MASLKRAPIIFDSDSVHPLSTAIVNLVEPYPDKKEDFGVIAGSELKPHNWANNASNLAVTSPLDNSGFSYFSPLIERTHTYTFSCLIEMSDGSKPRIRTTIDHDQNQDFTLMAQGEPIVYLLPTIRIGNTNIYRVSGYFVAKSTGAASIGVSKHMWNSKKIVYATGFYVALTGNYQDSVVEDDLVMGAINVGSIRAADVHAAGMLDIPLGAINVGSISADSVCVTGMLDISIASMNVGKVESEEGVHAFAIPDISFSNITVNPLTLEYILSKLDPNERIIPESRRIIVPRDRYLYRNRNLLTEHDRKIPIKRTK